MGIESEAFGEVMKLVNGWTARNQQLFPVEVRRKRIGQTDSLVGSFEGRVRSSGTTIYSDQVFDDSGRFVDMGVGRGHGIEDRAGKEMMRMVREDTNHGGGKGRKPKKWYRIFYARLNALQGAVGLKMMERGVDAVKQLSGLAALFKDREFTKSDG